MFFAVVLVGERLDGLTLGFAAAVLVTIALGRKMSVSPPATEGPAPEPITPSLKK
jgi:hypothetical protein